MACKGFLSERRRAATAARLLDDGRRQRRQHPLERRRDQRDGRASPRTRGPMHFLRREADAHRHHRAPLRRCGPSSDQVLAVFRSSDYTLEPTQSWDTLGMRGTCSVGFMLRAEGVADQILAEPYEQHPQPNDGAVRSYALGARLGGRRRRRRLRARGLSCGRRRGVRRPHAARRRASHPCPRLAARRCAPLQAGSRNLRTPRRRSGGARTSMNSQTGA